MRKNQLLFGAIIFGMLISAFLFSAVRADVSPAVIIKGLQSTYTRKVTLQLVAPSDIVEMKISNDPLLKGADFEPFKSKRTWFIPHGEGPKTVFVKFKDEEGNISKTFTDTVTLKVEKEPTANFIINDDEKNTASRYVTLDVTTSQSIEAVAISNSSEFSGVEYLSVQDSYNWILSSGSGEKTVYVRFRTTENKTFTKTKKITYTEPKPFIKEGSLLKAPGDSLYYLGFDGRLHAFPNVAVFHSWHKDFSNIQIVSTGKISEYQFGSPVCVRPGTWLVQFQTSPKVYAVEPGCKLRQIRSQFEAYAVYGPSWPDRVLTLDDVQASFYEIRDLTAQGDDVEDKDKDGLDAETELQYGSSDLNTDSDNDGLSDFEEVSYWFSDPTEPDTDGDGVLDEKEALSLQSPVGIQVLSSLPKDTYLPPRGTLFVKTGNSHMYYRHSNGSVYSVGKNTDSYGFVQNAFDPLFLSIPPLDLSFNVAGGIKVKENEAVRPTAATGNQITAL